MTTGKKNNEREAMREYAHVQWIRRERERGSMGSIKETCQLTRLLHTR
jgi:hypothetical protein